eukprot:scaffold369283_cov16-Prasinocladus_malaysianus.AAC.1
MLWLVVVEQGAISVRGLAAEAEEATLSLARDLPRPMDDEWFGYLPYRLAVTSAALKTVGQRPVNPLLGAALCHPN